MSFCCQSPWTFRFICSESSGPSDADWTIYKQMRGTTVSLTWSNRALIWFIICFHVCCNWHDRCVKRASEQSQRNRWVTMLQRASQTMLGSEESTRMLIWGSLAHMTNMRFCREKICQEMGNFYLKGAPHLVLFLIKLTEVSTIRWFF